MPTATAAPPVRRRTPLLFGAAVAMAAAAVVPVMSRDLGPTVGFLPMVLALVGCFDLVSVYLLLKQYRDEGDPRSLAMAVAYTWSLVVMIGYACAFPGVVGDPAPFASAPSVAPWLYVCWHTGFPVLLGASWAPWPTRWRATAPVEVRRGRALLTQLLAVASGGALVAAVVARGPGLPVLIEGLDTTRMTVVTAPVALPLVAAAVAVSARALRRRTGPERWTSVAVWICLVDLCLTYASTARFSAGWYAGRGLTVVAAGVVLLAMLHETTRVKAALHTTLERERQVERLQRSILDNLGDGVVLTDLEGRVLMLNRSMEQLFPHLVVGEVPVPLEVSTPTGEPVPAQERPAAVTAATGHPLRDRVLVVSTPAGPLWLSANSTPVPGEDGEPVAVLATYADVTARELARRELEVVAEQLAAARDVAVAAERAKSRFFASTSHEIRTPLNGVLGMTSLLQDTALDDRQREFVTTAHRCGEQLLALLNDVLDFSKADAGQLELDPRPLALAGLVHDALAMVTQTARAKGLAVDVELSARLPTTVLGDVLRLRQALLNLLSNAVKFTSSGRVLLTVAPDGGLVRFTVSDTGIGVDPAVVPGLFEPFRQADSGTTRRYGGTGLGLAITREIAMLHGGSVGAAPRPDGGSDFWFSAALPASAPAQPAAPDLERIVLSGHLLLAEDNLVNQRIASLVLEGMGLTVDVVSDGRQAVAAALGGTYDLVLMDCQMPELDGLHATRELRSRGCTLPVLALTASASREDEELCRAAGMDDYLTKPLDAQALARSLRHHLAAART